MKWENAQVWSSKI